MSSEDTYIKQLKEHLIGLNPHLILLFGSYAYGIPNEKSDIDLLVVTNDDYIPKNFKEHSIIYLKVSQAIRPVKKQIAIDLIVYTLPMYRKFKEQNSSFAYEILNRGKIIYERDHATVA
jgi:predicted nucleotidyltransferase